MNHSEVYDYEETETTIIRAVERAACAAWPWVGKGDGRAADHAATEAMRLAFDDCAHEVTVVIGEGERDEAPMLYRGEIFGRNSRLPLDCAVDPCDGTSLVKHNLPGGITLAAVAERGGLLGAPDLYMDKLAAPPELRGKVSLNQSIAERVKALAETLGLLPSELLIAVQERPRHRRLIEEIHAAGAKVQLFAEGDVSIALLAATNEGPFHAMMGIGAAPEGVITAAALKCLGACFEGRFVYDPDAVLSGLIGTCRQTNREKLIQSGIVDPDRIFDRDELAPGAHISVALCGITSGDLVRGVQLTKDESELETECRVVSLDTPHRGLRRIRGRYPLAAAHDTPPRLAERLNAPY